MSKRRDPRVDAAIALVRDGWMPRYAAEETGANYPTVRSRLSAMAAKGQTEGWYDNAHKSRNMRMQAKARHLCGPAKDMPAPKPKRLINPWGSR